MTTDTPDYLPKPEDEVLITVRAVVDSEGDYQLPSDVIGDCLRCDHWVRKGSVVRVEPVPVDLPTGWGARILATLNGGRDVRLFLACPGQEVPWYVNPEDALRVARDWAMSDDLSDVVVLDPGEVQS